MERIRTVTLSNRTRLASKEKHKRIKAKDSNLIEIVGSHSYSLNQSKIATLNARSVRSNLDIIKQITIEDNIQILALTETWLSEDHAYIPRELCPNGYQFLRADRVDRPGGGVGILSNASLKPKQIECGEFASFEHLLVSFKSGSNALRVLVVYRPPPCLPKDSITYFTSLLEQIALEDSPLVICSDFNLQ